MEEDCVKKEVPSDHEDEAINEEKIFISDDFKVESSNNHLKDEKKNDLITSTETATQDPEFILPDSGLEGLVKREKFAEEDDEEDLSDEGELVVVESALSHSMSWDNSQPMGSTDDENEGNSPVNHASRKRSRSTSPEDNARKTPSAVRSAVRKQLKNSGLPYVSSRGKPMQGAKMRRPCACSMDCVHKLTEDKRVKVFTAFWQLGDHGRQWEFIRYNSSCSKTKGGQKRSVHRSYFFTIDGEKIQICKLMFTSTLGISDSWISSAYSHVDPDEGVVIPERRGKHRNHRLAYTEAKIQTVEQHIATLPRVPAHYCRQKTHREYLEHGLSLAHLTRIYLKWAEEQGFRRSQIATRRQYIDIVNAHFNVAFFKTKKDRCKLCLVCTNQKTSRTVIDKYKPTFAAHLQNKKRAKELKEKDKKDGVNNPKVAVVSFASGRQLNCPKSENSPFYYVRKLCLFNCTFFNMIKRMGLCVLWHEGMGRRGSNEIASAVMFYIRKLHQEGYEDFRFWSENCAGQNKNRVLFAMYVYICTQLKIKVTHRFFEPGHTQTECDTIHARIDKYAERKELFDFEEWVQLIEEAKLECPRYEVDRLNPASILSFKHLAVQQNWDKDSTGNSIKWSKVKEITVDGTVEVAGLVRLKYNLFDDGYTAVNVQKEGGDTVDLAAYCPPKAHETAVPIPAKTKQDLQSILNDGIIPENYRDFYQKVLDGTSPLEDPDSEIDYETDEEICEGEVLLDVLDELRGSEENQEEQPEE